MSVEGDGSNSGLGNLADGTGPVVLNSLVPSDAQLAEIIPAYITDIGATVETTILDQVEQFNNFGLGYNFNTRSWYVVSQADLNTGAWSSSNAEDKTSAGLDSSWFIRFSTNGVSYTVFSRATKYVFESASRNKFYFDESVKINDPSTGYSIKDSVRVLKSNTGPDFTSALGYDYDWAIVKNIKSSDGYTDARKMQVGSM